jgi:RHS repeat-associated protein
MPGRKYQAPNSNKPRYGFNGKENDNEVKGDGNQQDYGMRIYDPRLGRFLSVDPITNEYPELSPYQFASNSPILGIDLDGLEFANPMGMMQKKHPVLTGMTNGVWSSLKGTWNFFIHDAWQGNTWKEAGKFLEEGVLSMSTVRVAPTPRIDLAVKNFEDNVINGNSYSRSKYLAEFGTNILTAYISSKGMGTFASFASKTVKTSFNIAKQSLTVNALKAAVKAKAGATLYRIGTTGKSAQGAAAQFWSLENPLLDPEGYAKKYNVPLENVKNADFIETAKVKNGANFITREAGEAPGSANTGKGIEVVVDKGGTTNNVIKPIKKE